MAAVALLAAPARADDVHSIKLRTEPIYGVNVSVGGGMQQPVSPEVPVALSFSDDGKPLQLTFYHPGFTPRECTITPNEASDAEGYYPRKALDPLTLSCTSPVLAFKIWCEEHPYKSGSLLFLLIVGIPPLAYRGFDVWRRQREITARIEQYESRRDATDSLLMQRIEGYLLVEKLGKGAMATVYKGIPAATMDESKAVAVKVLGREVFEDTEFRRRFKREVKAYQRLEHPNVVRLISWHDGDDSPYIILELVKGETLGARIPPQGMPWTEAAPLLKQLFAAVSYAHNRGVVHRDLKPENIMVCGNLVKVMDFGLARDADASQLTASGTVLGTPSYMAPEQLSRGSSESAVDQYALGAVAYQMLTGRLPHEAPDIMQLFSKVLSGTPTPARHYRPDLPAQLEAAIMRMLAREPSERFQSVSAAWKAVE